MPTAQPHYVKQLGTLHYHTLITLTRTFRETLHKLYISFRHLTKTYIKTFHKKNSIIAWHTYIFTHKKENSTY